MKKAIRITSIVYIPLLCLAALIFFIYGIIFVVASGNEEILQELTNSLVTGNGSHLSTQEMQSLVIGYATYFFVMLGFAIVGLVFDIIILNKIKKEEAGLENYSKANWITFGILAFIFSVGAPGVLSIVWGAVKKEGSGDKQVAQEVHFEEKDEQAKPKASDYDAPDHLDK